MPLALDRTEYSRSLAILPDTSAVLLGTDTHLRLFSTRDAHQIAAVAVPAAAWAVTVNAAGTVAVAALLDGTLRWYGLSHDAPLDPRVALFAHADGTRWVMFTPEGLFDHADRGGKDLVGVHLNRGHDQQPEWTSFSQAYRALYAPAAVRARLAGDAGPSRERLAELGDLRATLARQPAVEIAELCVPLADGTCAALDPHAASLPRLPAQTGKLRIGVQLADRGPGHRRHRCLRQRPQRRTLRRAGRGQRQGEHDDRRAAGSRPGQRAAPRLRQDRHGVRRDRADGTRPPPTAARPNMAGCSCWRSASITSPPRH